MKHFFGQLFLGGGLIAFALGIVSFMANDKFFNSQAPTDPEDFVMVFWAIMIPGGALTAILGARLLK